MSSKEAVFFVKPHLFNGTNFVFWKVGMREFLQTLGSNVWVIVEGGYQYLASITKNTTWKKQYETNAKVVNAILGSIVESEFMKFM